MKRAAVWHSRCGAGGPWWVDVYDGQHSNAFPIRLQVAAGGGDEVTTEHPTHADALAHALAEVGLTTKETN